MLDSIFSDDGTICYPSSLDRLCCDSSVKTGCISVFLLSSVIDLGEATNISELLSELMFLGLLPPSSPFTWVFVGLL